MSNMFDLSGRVAIVSGTASGMGEAMALTFAENGADLVLLDMNTAGNEETAHAIEKMGRRAIPLTCDVSKYSDIDKVYETVDKEFGHVDILSHVVQLGAAVAKPA
ncbi:MAG TPA: SDR family NAD(P)-dependent oxidoreductase, partial [Thermoflexales bacterium]|nr:SDR family NAD(P)-dependent oxidoreductase [Thermoflexales bacterium]